MTSEIKQIAERIRGMRDILEISVKEMAELLNLSEEEYAGYERGEKDYSFTFLNTCANRFGIDLAELLTGEDSRLTSYAVDRKGAGLPIVRRAGFDYRLLGSRFSNRMLEPHLVTVPFKGEKDASEISTSRHAGQEFDFVLEGTLKVTINGKMEILNEGDCILYDSSSPHGMAATNGKSCSFLAILVKG